MSKKLIIIYDFDGTLTPNPVPKYKILEQCGYDSKKLIEEVKKMNQETGLDLYNCIFEVYFSVLKKNNIELIDKNINLGASNVELSEGLIEYFESLKEYDVDNYVITSGIKTYLENTKIAKYIKEIYGTIFNYDNNHITSIKELITDYKKVEIIKSILNEYNKKKNEIKCIYIGDGLTDIYAMKYVKSIGGKSYVVYKDVNELEKIKIIIKNNIVDNAFKRSFKLEESLYKEIAEELKV